MKRNLKLLKLFVLLTILSVSCQGTPTAQSTPAAIPSVTPESSVNWWTIWLAEPICKPPCWQNIIPGVTTKDEAMSILENKPEIKITFRSSTGADWDFIQNKDEGGTLIISEDGIVDTIWLYGIADRKLYLETIVEVYDNPEYVKPYDCREAMCSTVLIYPDLGMFLSVFTENTGKDNDSPQIEILPDTVVRRVYFIEEGMENFQKIPDFQDYDLLMDWKGYGEYP